MEVDMGKVDVITRRLVRDLLEKEDLHNWTLRMVRYEVAKRMGLEEDALMASEYKPTFKRAIQEMQERYEENVKAAQAGTVQGSEPGASERNEQEAEDDSEDVQPRPSIKKRKSSDTPPSSSSSERKGKKQSGKPVQTKKATVKKTNAKTKTNFRSPSVVPSSDEEGGENDGTSKPNKTLQAPKKKDHGPPPKKRRKSVPQDSLDDESSERKSQVKPISVTPTRSEGKTEHSDVDMKSPSDESRRADTEEEDGKPSKKQSAATSAAKETKSGARSRKSKSSEDKEDKDDKEIKRLKSLLSAAGLRKPYAKLFAQQHVSEDKRGQIRVLKNILRDECGLGKDGKKMTLKQAKEFKEKRELEKELEDVKRFEKSVVEGPRASRSTARKKVAPASDDHSGSEVEEDVVDLPKKRKMNAARSIMAFLEDQSDDE
ncbi:hypothetical protein K474DRAFT_1665346 [Panus rudis PR-1116 ss-1]|nr:hypothetical protein K474DRAFT_1665346 [Panus rudis PR-1116 ss-1]